MRTLTDARGVEIRLPDRAERAACLYPSGTGTQAAPGLAARLGARTARCPEAGGAAAVGGTKEPDLARLRALESLPRILA